MYYTEETCNKAKELYMQIKDCRPAIVDIQSETDFTISTKGSWSALRVSPEKAKELMLSHFQTLLAEAQEALVKLGFSPGAPLE